MENIVYGFDGEVNVFAEIESFWSKTTCSLIEVVGNKFAIKNFYFEICKVYLQLKGR